MVVEAIVAGLVVVTVSALQFAKAVDPLLAKRRALREKRRVIERKREVWMHSLSHAPKNMTHAARLEHSQQIEDCDHELAKIADEEVRLG